MWVLGGLFVLLWLYLLQLRRDMLGSILPPSPGASSEPPPGPQEEQPHQ
jgi:hypothetical protein